MNERQYGCVSGSNLQLWVILNVQFNTWVDLEGQVWQQRTTEFKEWGWITSVNPPDSPEGESPLEAPGEFDELWIWTDFLLNLKVCLSSLWAAARCECKQKSILKVHVDKWSS